MWLLILVGVGYAASAAPAPPADTFSMPGTESQKAFDLLKERFPGASADGATARVVIRAPEGDISDPGQRACSSSSSARSWSRSRPPSGSCCR